MAFILRIDGVGTVRASTKADFELSASRDAAAYGAITAIGCDDMPGGGTVNWYVCKLDNTPRPGLDIKLAEKAAPPPAGYTKSAEGYLSLGGPSKIYIVYEQP